MKPRRRTTTGRQGVKISVKVDRGQLIIDDPAKYFSEARQKAREQVERDLKRERLLAGS